MLIDREQGDSWAGVGAEGLSKKEKRERELMGMSNRVGDFRGKGG